MSQTLIIQVSDETFAVLQRQAKATNTSPASVAATSLEQQFGAQQRSVRRALIEAGLVSADAPPLTDAAPLSTEQRRTLAQDVSGGRPLSAYIRDERDER